MVSTRELSQRYAAYLHTQLVGDDTEAVDFGLWLDAHWCEDVVAADEVCRGQGSNSGSLGGAVSWVEHGDEFIGQLVGRTRGCYRVSREADVPVIALLLDDASGCSTGSAMQERAFRYADDRVADVCLSVPVGRTAADMAEPLQPAALPLTVIPDLAADSSHSGSGAQP